MSAPRTDPMTRLEAGADSYERTQSVSQVFVALAESERDLAAANERAEELQALLLEALPWVRDEQAGPQDLIEKITAATRHPMVIASPIQAVIGDPDAVIRIECEE